MLNEGDLAPDFSLPTLTGEVNLKSALEDSEKGVILYFYPLANTPGCTTQACDFRDNLGRLSALGYTVIAVSPDRLPALEKFSGKYDLNFVLASDVEKEVMGKYGTWGEKFNYGVRIMGTIRSTFVIAKDGTITHALYNVRAKGHVDRLLEKLG